ncbi:hypothetical protein B0J17DRAFT_660180 [Rhizoctonia solani]|nr:hypothetical protein B0J17DRAFT_660180 [Rhizoctonia solani]
MTIVQRLPFPLAPKHSHAASRNPDPQDSAARYIRRLLFGSLLDRNLESNSLPFVLESFAAWIHRTTFDPVKVVRNTKDRIVMHYADSVESRWITIILANLVGILVRSRLMSQARNLEYMSIVSTLQEQVRRRIAVSQPASHFSETGIRNATMVLDNITNMMLIFALAGNISPGMKLMGNAAPIFHRACTVCNEPNLIIGKAAFQSPGAKQHTFICIWGCAE